MLASVARRSWARTRLPLVPASTFSSPFQAFTTDSQGGGKDSDPPKSDGKDAQEEEEDEFGLDGFDLKVDDEEESAAEKLRALAEQKEDITPELASDLVERMVESAAGSLGKNALGKADIIPSISPHTISVLRASRISTNAVHAAASETYPYPVTKKVSGQIDIAALSLSRPAEEVLKTLAGPRVAGDTIKFSSEKFPSMEENRAHIVSSIHRLVAAAKIAVGDEVDDTPLESWADVTEEVQKQAADEIAEVGDVSKLLLTAHEK